VLASCDALFRHAPPRTEYARIGTSCGDKSILQFAGSCARFFSTTLEQLPSDCTCGDPSACPRLALAAPPGSPYQRLAAPTRRSRRQPRLPRPRVRTPGRPPGPPARPAGGPPAAPGGPPGGTAQTPPGDRGGPAPPDPPALDQHGDRQVAPGADEPGVGLGR